MTDRRRTDTAPSEMPETELDRLAGGITDGTANTIAVTDSAGDRTVRSAKDIPPIFVPGRVYT